jgi:hypothetical protein
MLWFKKNFLKILTTTIIAILLISLTGCEEKEYKKTLVNEYGSSMVSEGVNLDDLSNIVNGQYYFDDGINQYYSSFDKNSLPHIYQKNINSGDTKIIFDGFGWSFVMHDGWLYFSGNQGTAIDGTYNLFRMKPDGSNLEHLNNTYCYSMHFYDKGLYYLKKSSWGDATSDVYRSSVDGKNEELIVSGIRGYSIVYNNKLYYLGGDYYIYEANPDGSNKKQILSEMVYVFVIGQGKIIYIDNNYNIKTSRIDGSDVKTVKETDGKEISTVNSYKDTIFYVKYNSTVFDYESYSYPYELYSIKINGTNDKKIYESTSWGFYINVIKNKLYVLDYAIDSNNMVLTAIIKNMDFDGSGIKELYR